jgi:DNA-binding MarR family transcriptional regulator
MTSPSAPTTDKQVADSLSGPQCVCAALRRATRLITRKYDRYLLPTGLRVTQYSLLANIIRNPDITVSNLSNLLAMEQTTTTRNLQVLKKAGLIRLAQERADQRTKTIRISAHGRKTFERARPFWAKAQREVEQLIGASGVNQLLKSLGSIEG